MVLNKSQLNKNLLYIFLSIIVFMASACNKIVKTEEDEERFDRQASEISKDELLIGDDLNYWGSDAPRGSIFIFNGSTNRIKSIGLKPIMFKESDKTIDEISKQIETSPIYQIELYQLPKPEKIDQKVPQICEYISERFNKAELIKIVNKVSLRVKERNWVNINAKVRENNLTFIRIGVGELYSSIKNRATDAFWINAKRNDKNWEEISNFDRKKINAWSCQEYTFMENNIIQGVYYNPDIIFNYE